ncbi:VIT1/CCC1 transporter family protein [Bartonella sp. A05]|uniref:VIT1/CCC1 transporter family protein n=1 Tax=Bartonella sp. A05 TaxID=2967261 RepID=UPI0022A9DABB|nr:hypothetical protein [Bartonella sp. A05]MCZ2203680.1 hypothetical protein [Bartonella sp. A05]
MLKSFFSFVPRHVSSSCAPQEMIARTLKSKKKQAAFYLKAAKALQRNSPNQAELFAAMGVHKLENYQRLLCLFHNAHAKDMIAVRDKPSFAETPSSYTSLQTTTEVNKATQEQVQTQTDKQTLLTWIQPGLAGLMDGSVSTLAPIFAAAFATGDTHQTFLIGLSASVGAGLSMGFTEAAHDDGKLSGRGSPLKRGIASGVMTTVGGLGHALPYLINSFYLATTLAFIIVFFELWAIVWIQNKFMSTPFWRASLQVIIGGALVFATGILIGNI